MELIYILIILLISCGFGMFCLDSFKFKFSYANERIVFSTALGMGILGYLVFFLGIADRLNKISVITLLSLLVFISIQKIIYILKRLISSLREFRFTRMPFFIKALSLALLLGLLFTFLATLAPPIGNDSLAYRLVQVKTFLQNQRFSYLPYTRESLWPYLIESLFALCMLIGSDILVKLMAYSFGILSLLTVYFYVRNRFSKEAGIISAAIFFLTPAIFTQITYAYVDIPQAFYGFLALLSLFKYMERRKSRWLALSGVFCGFVLSIKYTGVITLLALIIAVIYLLYIQKKQRILILFKALGIFIFFTGLCSFVWYLRSFVIKGNPLYPFFAEFFNYHGWSRGLENNIASKFSLLNLIRLPWTLTMFPQYHGGESFGVAYLLFLPLAITLKNRIVQIKAMAMFAISYLVIWFFVDPVVVRFLFPILMPLAILVGCGLMFTLKEKGPFSAFVKLLLLSVCLFNLALLFYHCAEKAMVPLRLKSRQAYLSEAERTYDIGEYINNNIPKDAKILMINEIRAYYINRPYIHLKNLIEEDGISESELNSPKFLNRLKKYNIDYILYLDNAFYSKDKLFKILPPNKKPIYAHTYIDRKGRRLNYCIYKI